MHSEICPGFSSQPGFIANVAGDFNFYTSNEEGYIKLLDNNNPIQIIDPIDRPCPTFPNDGVDYFDFNNYNINYFWRNSTFSDIHTQSTRTSTAGLIDQGGATGGLDDRFDFIMMSKNLQNSSQLYYVDNSYKTIGNHGNCYNSYISDPNCSGALYTQTVRNSLIQFSDHLPVVMEIESPENTLTTSSYSLPLSIFGSNVVRSSLSLNVEENQLQKAVIYNSLGQKVKSLVFEKNSNQKKITISVENFSKGIYYIKFEQYSSPIKFIKI